MASSTNQITQQAIKACLLAGTPALLIGPPGGGKSSMVNALAQSMHAECITVLGSIREATDFAGLPVKQNDGTVTLAPPLWARQAEKLAEKNPKGHVIVFLDEITTVPPSVQAAMLRVILDRAVGDLNLPSNVKFIAAGNSAEQAADGYDLSEPLANRFAHFEWNADLEEWCKGIMGGWGDPRNSTEAMWKAMGTAYLKAHRTAFYPGKNANKNGAFPSARSWDKALVTAAVAQDSGASEDVLSAVVAGLVGADVALAFMTYRRELDLPDPEDVLKAPEKWTPPLKSDHTYAVISSVVAAVKSQLTEKRWQQGLKVMLRTAEFNQPDVGIVGLVDLKNIRQPSWSFGNVSEGNAEALRKTGEILIRAGIATDEELKRKR